MRHIDIDSLSEEELLELNHKVVARLRFLSQMRSHSAMLDFRSRLFALTAGLGYLVRQNEVLERRDCGLRCSRIARLGNRSRRI